MTNSEISKIKESNFMMQFRVSSKLFKELGKNLVSKPSIALAELIKNSYDADATRVTVDFRHITEKNGIIIVQDNGEGITKSRLEKTWMTVATSDKEKVPFSKKLKRVKTGKKGIGRFACQALANTLILETIAIDDDNVKRKIEGTFYWDQFESNREIVDVPIQFKTSKVPDYVPTGTKITLYKLVKKWTKEEIKQLHKEILGLISPFEIKDDSSVNQGFDIHFKIPEFPEFSGKLTFEISQYAWGELVGEVNKSGFSNYTLKTKQNVSEISLNKKFVHLGKCYFKIYIHFFGRGTTKAIRKEIEEGINGVRVYVDGFRVFSYGEPEDDWLDIQKDIGRRLATTPSEFKHIKADRPLLRLPSNNHLIGGVFLSRIDNLEIEQTINRDRLLENDAFNELKYLVRKGIEWATIKYAQFFEERRRRRTDPKSSKESLQSSVRNLRKKINNLKPILESNITKEEFAEIILDLDIIENKEKQIANTLSIMRLLASVGTTVLLFEHEINQLINNLNEISINLTSLIDFIEPSKSEELKSIITLVRNWSESSEKLASMSGLIQKQRVRQVRRRISYKTVLDELNQTFSNYFKENGITFINELDEFLRSPPMYLIELYSIFLNLITNSIKAILSPKNKGDRKIRVWHRTSNNKNLIYFEDSGIGIEPEYREKVFDAFYSTSEPDIAMGKGTGLGLTIVREIIQENKGKINFIEPKEQGALARIELPTR